MTGNVVTGLPCPEFEKCISVQLETILFPVVSRKDGQLMDLTEHLQ